MRDEPLHRCPQRRDIGVEFLLPCGQLAVLRLLARRDHSAALISLVSDTTARIPDDLRGRRLRDAMKERSLPLPGGCWK